jgi:hypothetical protein
MSAGSGRDHLGEADQQRINVSQLVVHAGGDGTGLLASEIKHRRKAL